MIRIALLGSTGSIGTNALDVISRSFKDRYSIVGLSADSNIKLLSDQARRTNAKIIAVRDASLASKIKKDVRSTVKVVCGIEGLSEIASRNDVDLVVFATSGSTCIIPLVDAIESKKRIALANKESLVSAGSIIMKKARDNNVNIIPIDSEHSAIFQCLEGRRDFLSKIYLTGSGGPLLKVPKNRFGSLSREAILNHPKWKMGKKISVDSATMMNKGLEIIEAKWLFDIDADSIEVLIHPEAIIHSMVELLDGTVFAQLGVPDMRLPIQYALTYPSRFRGISPRIDFIAANKLTFLKPDTNKFPCLCLARAAIEKKGTDAAVLNAADEEVVKCYLEGSIPFSSIPKIIEKVLGHHRPFGKSDVSIKDVLAAECWAREEARSFCCH